VTSVGMSSRSSVIAASVEPPDEQELIPTDCPPVGPIGPISYSGARYWASQAETRVIITAPTALILLDRESDRMRTYQERSRN
jgi:hypothetical protein